MPGVRGKSTPEIMTARAKISNGVRWKNRELELEGRYELSRLRLGRVAEEIRHRLAEADEAEREYAEVTS